MQAPIIGRFTLAPKGVADKASQIKRRRYHVADKAPYKDPVTRDALSETLHLRRSTCDASPETHYPYAASSSRHGGDVLPADLRRARPDAAGGDRAIDHRGPGH